MWNGCNCRSGMRDKVSLNCLNTDHIITTIPTFHVLNYELHVSFED